MSQRRFLPTDFTGVQALQAYMLDIEAHELVRLGAYLQVAVVGLLSILGYPLPAGALMMSFALALAAASFSLGLEYAKWRGV